MKIESTREFTKIELGEAYCFNYDKMIDMCVYLAAKDYYEYGGGKRQQAHYTKMYMEGRCGEMDYKYMVRQYKRLEFALKRFEGKCEDEIVDMAYYFNSRMDAKYYGAIETLFEIRGLFWN